MPIPARRVQDPAAHEQRRAITGLSTDDALARYPRLIRAMQGQREVYDRAIVDVDGVPTKREYVSRYDEEGNYMSQGYTHHGPASPNETSAKTWRHR